MAKYKVTWRDGNEYVAEVIAGSKEEACKIAADHKKLVKHFCETLSIEEAPKELLKHTALWNDKYGNATEEEAIELLRTTNKPIVYTHGLEYRKPATHRVPITREKALEEANKYGFNLTEEENCVHLNTFSGSDWD